MPSKICGSEPLVFCVWVDRCGYVRKGEKKITTHPLSYLFLLRSLRLFTFIENNTPSVSHQY